MKQDKAYIDWSDHQIAKAADNQIRDWVNLFTFVDDGWTAAHLACKTSIDIFMLLIEYGCDVHLKNKKDMTLMHKAAFDDNTYLITYLRDMHGFDVSHTDKNGNTPLHFACAQGSEYASFWLIGFGAPVDAANKDGDTALHLLMKNSEKLHGTKTFRELLFKGCDKTIVNLAGK